MSGDPVREETGGGEERSGFDIAVRPYLDLAAEIAGALRDYRSSGRALDCDTEARFIVERLDAASTLFLQGRGGEREWLVYSEEDDQGVFVARTAAEAVELWRCEFEIAVEDGQGISVYDMAQFRGFTVRQTNRDEDDDPEFVPEFTITQTRGPHVSQQGSDGMSADEERAILTNPAVKEVIEGAQPDLDAFKAQLSQQGTGERLSAEQLNVLVGFVRHSAPMHKPIYRDLLETLERIASAPSLQEGGDDA